MLAVVKKTYIRRLVRSIATSNAPRFTPCFDPYTYSKGRWLHRDKEQQEARRLYFDFDSLLDLAVECSPNAKRVVNCELKEGGFNRVFIASLDNGKSVVARLPNRTAGPPGLTVSSEVATLKFVRERTQVPVPRVLRWSSEANNPVGAEYMIMNTMPGISLSDVWNDMPASQHIGCIGSMASLFKGLFSHSFPSYGSLYLNTNRPQSAVPLDDTFCIGPLCGRQHWGYEISKPFKIKALAGNQGPWTNVREYLTGLIERAKLSIPLERLEARDSTISSIESHTNLLNAFNETMSSILESDIIKEAAGPTLFHPDFHTRNILVDPEDHTKITGILDWQSAAIEPAFVFAAETPDFSAELSDDGTSDRNSTDDPDVLTPRERLQADVEFCVRTWAVVSQLWPKYREASALDSSLLNFLAAGSAGWLDNTVVTRSILDDLNRDWKEIGLPGQTSYRPSKDEIEQQRAQADEMHGIRHLKEHLTRLLGCDTDGWVPIDRWEETLPRYREEYRRFIASLGEGVSSTEDKAEKIAEANRLWPFDQR